MLMSLRFFYSFIVISQRNLEILFHSMCAIAFSWSLKSHPNSNFGPSIEVLTKVLNSLFWERKKKVPVLHINEVLSGILI